MISYFAGQDRDQFCKQKIAHFYAHDRTKTLSLHTFLTMKYDIITGNSFCEEIRLYYFSNDEAEDLHVSQIVNCVFNAVLSYNTAMLNIATIYAITKTSSLPKPLKTLLLSLAASDLGVGLMVQPLFITLLIQWLQQLSPSCIMYTCFSVAMNLFFTASFANIIGITLDRCLAIQLHLRYQNIVTHWRVIAVVIFISGAPNGNFRENTCSEDDLTSRIFGAFAVKFLAYLPIL